MALWFAALLGLIQGLTEFIPVSSTGHLRVAPALLGQPDPGAAFSAVIQLGTLLAVIIYFARDLFVTMPRAMFVDRGGPEARLPVYIALGTIPIVICGLAFKDFIVGDARSLYVVAAALSIFGGVMWIADKKGANERPLDAMTMFDALIIGGAQTLALVPGVSRSGSTIVAALLLGMRRAEAARFSFLLSIPAIGGAGLFELRDAAAAFGDDAWAPILVGTATAAISGYLSIAWLMRYLGRKTLVPFAVYRIALAAFLLVLLSSGTVAAL